jgi:hypothetical protein
MIALAVTKGTSMPGRRDAACGYSASGGQDHVNASLTNKPQATGANSSTVDKRRQYDRQNSAFEVLLRNHKRFV